MCRRVNKVETTTVGSSEGLPWQEKVDLVTFTSRREVRKDLSQDVTRRSPKEKLSA